MVVYQKKSWQVTTYWLHDHRSAPKSKWAQVSKQIIAIRKKNLNFINWICFPISQKAGLADCDGAD